ncbi:hypothetical protein [Hymenobacter cheonanensis]|uniref:hypothetical protein n=1 Tax=Hymenobacter sp. CA2-7 TaxID=3063993 RepID=UPI002713F0C0|nr:hypothetical protein [Hymenobacter sp. CA2-7]MDO7887850.1 hypothetical protein [Hymenobacter sp. CA2-7]
MSWIEAKHRRSEEKAELLQSAELEKIRLARESLFEVLSALAYDKHGLSIEEVDVTYLFLSDDTDCSDYGTDTYRLAKELNGRGRILKLETLSPFMLHKHGLYAHLANSPASSGFPAACSYSTALKALLGLERKYQYKSAQVIEDSSVYITFKHEGTNSFVSTDEIMPDGSPRQITKQLPVVCDKDYFNVRTLFLLVSARH